MARPALKTLYCDTIHVTAQMVDWEEALGEDLDGFEVWEAVRCDECGKIAVIDRLGHCEHCDLDGHTRCAADIYCEGPQMRYFYPLPWLRVSPEAAARLLINLPLCLVMLHGEYGLALTGGGMDLSWEICEAFMLLGFLPPFPFTDLPAYSGKPLSARNRWIIAGCRRTAQVMARQAQWRLPALQRLRQQMAPSS